MGWDGWGLGLGDVGLERRKEEGEEEGRKEGRRKGRKDDKAASRGIRDLIGMLLVRV